MPVTLQEALRRGAHLLALPRKGSDEAHLEAEILLAHALGLDRVHLYQRLREELTADQSRSYQALLDRRLSHEPTAYIVGHKEFYGLEFEVTPAAIIPRPETEALVELALDFAGSRVPSTPLRTGKGQGLGVRGHELRVADVGAGCGAIAVAVAHELPAARVIATDSSAEALTLARRNARRHGVEDRIEFLHGDLLEPLQGSAHPEPKPGGSRDSSRRVDVIAANLPYVRTGDWERLPPEIRDHEPRGGLDGGPDGLRVIEWLLRQAPGYLKPGGALFVEIGDEHGEAATRLARGAFRGGQIEVKPDLAGFDRVLVVRT